MSQSYDAIIIGAGQSGPPLAVRLAQAGRRVLLVERTHIGGTCVNDGCTPTKAMVASAKAIHMARHAADYGFRTGDITVDMAAVKARKDKIVQASIDGLTAWVGDTENLTYLRGDARFIGPHEIVVGKETFVAEHIFVNVGARAVVPDWAAEVPNLTNTGIMDLDVVPQHLLIVGGSYIGLEFAQMYRRFGAKVTVLEVGERLAAREDPDVSDAILEILEAEGIEVLTRVGNFAGTAAGAGLRLEVEVAGEKRGLDGSHLLLAIGRRPNTDTLGCELAGIKTDAKGYIEVDDQLRTSADGVWAIGDVNGRGAFTHTSYNDYEIVAANLLAGEARRLSDRILVYGLFIDPPLGRVGMTETQARESGRKVLMGKMPMTRVGRARERGETKGFMKVLVDADTKHFLGAAFLGDEGDEAIHTVIDLMAAKVPYTSMQRTVHIHPTVSELIPTLLGDLKPLD